MFGWPSIGLAMAFGAFFGVYAGFGLALLIGGWCKAAPLETDADLAYYEDETDYAVSQRLLKSALSKDS